MRTTLDIESDVMAAARELARQQNVAIGTVISRLVRDALASRADAASARVQDAGVAGFRPFPSRGAVVTNEMIDRLRDIEGA